MTVATGNWAKAAVHFLHNYFFWIVFSNFATGLLCGSYLGKKIVNRTDAKAFRTLIEFMLAIAGNVARRITAASRRIT
jgi:uncharacterized membrane protein YfcA